MMSFAQWQPMYAAHGLSTFPVEIADGKKKPKVKNYLRAGGPSSNRWAQQFPDAQAFGFALGPRSKITVLDSDSTDERILVDAMERHGKSPLIVRSGSGYFQAWYRHNGEGRHVRPDPQLPIDILGGGFVVAPPSMGAKFPYQIIEGSLDDLRSLPPRQNFVPVTKSEEILEGQRNDALWRHCMKHCRSCDDFNALLDVAHTYNVQSMIPPLDADDVERTAWSVWQKTEKGENWFGQNGAFLTGAEIDSMLGHPFLFQLYSWLKKQNGPNSRFLVADGLAPTLRFPRAKLRSSRKELLTLGWIKLVRPAAPGFAALYRWGPRAGKDLSISVGLATSSAANPRRSRGSVIEDSLPKSVGLCQTPALEEA